MRKMKLIRKYTETPEGSVLIECGNTKILCTATISKRVPNFLRNQNQGWITAEYSMLPRATKKRNIRESIIGKQYGRNYEVQRFISRSLRASVNLKMLGTLTIILDCDVLQADGSTRTTAINGSYIALLDAINFLIKTGIIKNNPIKFNIAAISVGIVNNQELCDLNFLEDSIADFDMNIVMNEKADIIEIQGTSEKSQPINQLKLISLIEIAKKEIFKIIKKQKKFFIKNINNVLI